MEMYDGLISTYMQFASVCIFLGFALSFLFWFIGYMIGRGIALMNQMKIK